MPVDPLDLDAAREAVRLAEKLPPYKKPVKAYSCQFAKESPGSACGFNGESVDRSRDQCNHTLDANEAHVMAHALNNYARVSRALLAQAERVRVLEGLLKDAHMKLREDQEDLEARLDAALNGGRDGS